MSKINSVLIVDFETRYAKKATNWSDKPYTLSSMTTEEYIRDPRFKAFGACIKTLGDKNAAQWYSGAALTKKLASIDWTTTGVLAHNAMFDVGILSMRYGVKPAFILDTLSMARAMRGADGGNSLFMLAREFGLPPKGDAVNSTDGVYELTPDLEQELADYCAHDVWLCEQIYYRMRFLPDGQKFPASELRLIDLTLRMFTEPVLELDRTMLEKAVVEDEAKLKAVLARANADEFALASNPQFAEVLLRMGVTPPMKKSKTTGKMTYAFAKNDAMFQAMLNGDNEEVALLCEARLRVKSTLERTRAKRFIDISRRGCLIIPLYYYGAHSGRWSATGKINMQNMKRGSFLRMSICAPKGFVLVVGDLSQIEPRVLAWLSDYEEMLETFRTGADPYSTFGAQMFGIPGMTKESHPLLRQSAKSALLGCFGSSTPVLTNRGWVNIVDVTTADLLWDGVEWVTHQGLLAQGEKEVLTQYGVSATSDHEILTARGWAEWREVLASPSLFQSAINTENLPASAATPVPEQKPRLREWLPLRQRMQTYDIAMAGPRNRFTIRTDAGPLIVHNCGYMLGWASFAAQLLVGFLGAPPQRYTGADAKQLGVTRQDVYDFMAKEAFMEKMKEIPHTCTEAELIVHCVCARAIVMKYRATAEPVTSFWKLLGELIPYSLLDGNEFEYKCLKFRKGEIVLPNGMSLRYPDIKVHYDAKNRASYTYWSGKAHTNLYAGKIANNVTQALARIVMTEGMLRVAPTYRPLFTVHDEFGVLAREEDADAAVALVEGEMTKAPTWMPGIPLASDVGAAARYGLVK